MYIFKNKSEYSQYEHTRQLGDVMTLIWIILLHALSLGLAEIRLDEVDTTYSYQYGFSCIHRIKMDYDFSNFATRCPTSVFKVSIDTSCQTMWKSKIDSDIVWRSYAHCKTDSTIGVFTNGLHFIKFLHTSKGVYKQLRPCSTFRNKNGFFVRKMWQAMQHWSVTEGSPQKQRTRSFGQACAWTSTRAQSDPWVGRIGQAGWAGRVGSADSDSASYLPV